MPPKPWQRQPTTQENSGDLVQALASTDPELSTPMGLSNGAPGITTEGVPPNADGTTNPTNVAGTSSLGRSSYGGGMGGGYGGMSSMGMGGMGGMGMGMGGMGMGMGKKFFS
jgi:hypothetical protein